MAIIARDERLSSTRKDGPTFQAKFLIPLPELWRVAHPLHSSQRVRIAEIDSWISSREGIPFSQPTMELLFV